MEFALKIIIAFWSRYKRDGSFHILYFVIKISSRKNNKTVQLLYLLLPFSFPYKMKDLPNCVSPNINFTGIYKLIKISLEMKTQQSVLPSISFNISLQNYWKFNVECCPGTQFGFKPYLTLCLFYYSFAHRQA